LSSSLTSKLWDLASRLLDEVDEEIPSAIGDSKHELLDKARLAKEEWLAAQTYFNYAVEQELIDHAILSLQAAERKYMYWLNKVKAFDLE